MRTISLWVGTLLLVLIWNFYACGLKPTRMLSFEEAYRITWENNPAIKQAQREIMQKEYELKAKKGLYLPQVSLNAKAMSMSEKLHLDMTPVRDAIVPLYETLGTYGTFSGVPNPDPNTNGVMPILPDAISTQAVRGEMLKGAEEVANGEWDILIQDQNFASLTADFIWPLIMGGKVRGANQAANVEVEISEHALHQKEAVLMSELVARYYGLALGQKVTEVRKKTLQVMENHYSNAQKLYDNGMIAKVELLHASVSKSEAEREYKQALRNVEIVRSGFASTLFLDTTINLTPISPLFINESVPDVEYWIDEAKINNPLLKQIEGKREMAQIKQKVDKGSYLPSVAVMGTYNLAEKNLSPYVPEWMVGIGVKWDIFKGMGRKNTIKASENLIEQVDFAQKKALSDIEIYITKLYHELQMQMEQRDQLEQTLAMVEEYRESTEEAFNEGLATSIMVVDANTKVAQVEALRLKSFYEYDVCLARLLQIVGSPNQFLNYCTE